VHGLEHFNKSNPHGTWQNTMIALILTGNFFLALAIRNDAQCKCSQTSGVINYVQPMADWHKFTDVDTGYVIW